MNENIKKNYSVREDLKKSMEFSIFFLSVLFLLCAHRQQKVTLTSHIPDTEFRLVH